jgi:DNA-binding NarL/FixJ family response regulator
LRLPRRSSGLAQGGIDVVLLDLSLPDSQGINTAASVSAFAPEMPIVVLTGRDDQATGAEALRLGGAGLPGHVPRARSTG